VKKTLLLDLDGTLLENDVNISLPVYIQLFAQHVADLITPELFVQSLLGGSRLMLENTNPDRTLEEVYYSYFYAQTGVNEEEFLPYHQEFYSQNYQEVRPYTHPVPGVGEFIERVSDLGFTIVIATNPLFPLTAIQQRLVWAGISMDQSPIQLITSIENSHFTKPNPAYFAEILGKLGWPDGRIIMVGDDMERDIIPSNLLGLDTFWIEQPGNLPSSSSQFQGASGTIKDFLPWLLSTPDKPFKANLESIPAMVAILRSTPAALNSICNQLDGPGWKTRPDIDNWCPTEIICHLRDFESEVSFPRITQILTQSNPFITGVDSDAWSVTRNYRDQDGLHALSNFTRHRIELLDLLDEMDEDAWSKIAQHSIFGRISIQELVRINCAHDIMHIRQLYQDLHP